MGLRMTYDQEAHFRQLNEATKIWDEPQFTVTEVCKITGATPKALEHFLTPARGLVRLMGDWVNPGTGKRRIFTGSQVLQIAAAYTMNHIGFPQRWSAGLAEAVARRATARTIGLASQSEMSIVTYPMSNGDWVSVPTYREMTSKPNLPVAVQILDVDRLIDQVHSQLRAIVAGDDIPDYNIPDIQPEPNPYSPAVNFFREWEKDSAGNWLFVGLTLDETREYLDLQGWRLIGDDLEYDDPAPRLSREEVARSVLLQDKHQMAKPGVNS